jgi:uncharacterized membrane protein (UPF0136 family)
LELLVLTISKLVLVFVSVRVCDSERPVPVWTALVGVTIRVPVVSCTHCASELKGKEVAST